jgi:hypothetical protein
MPSTYGQQKRVFAFIVMLGLCLGRVVCRYGVAENHRAGCLGRGPMRATKLLEDFSGCLELLSNIYPHHTPLFDTLHSLTELGFYITLEVCHW